MALALVTFALRAYINVGTGVFVVGILILTTIFLALNFIPKVRQHMHALDNIIYFCMIVLLSL